MKNLTGRIARRGSIVAIAYLSTSLITLAVLFVFARHGDAALLRSILGAQFIASLAAGLEPATAKALALDAPRSAAPSASLRTLFVVTGLKAVVASPVLAVVWRLSDRTAEWPLLACAPLVCIAGFAATDLRVLFDLEGRHAAAIWVKQGSLGGGLIILALLAGMGAPLPLALAVASLTRLASTLLAARFGWPGQRPTSGARLADMMRDPRWMSLAGASVVAAIGGSADRVFGLRYLSADAWAGYFALYEVFSKFWFIPYVVAPIVFARAAGGLDSVLVSRLAWRMTAAAGAVFVFVVGTALLAMPSLPQRLLGARLDAGIPSLAILAFVAAVAVGSLAQIRIAELQGKGAAHRSLVIMGMSAVVTTGLFYAAARWWGVPGLLYAWFAKSLTDLALTYARAWPLQRVSRA